MKARDQRQEEDCGEPRRKQQQQQPADHPGEDEGQGSPLTLTLPSRSCSPPPPSSSFLSPVLSFSSTSWRGDLGGEEEKNNSNGSFLLFPVERNADPKLDFFSEEFDPLAALYHPTLVPPKKVKPLDNLAEYETRFINPQRKGKLAASAPQQPAAAAAAAKDPQKDVKNKKWGDQKQQQQQQQRNSPRANKKDEMTKQPQASATSNTTATPTVAAAATTTTTTAAAAAAAEEKEEGEIDEEVKAARKKRKKIGPALYTDNPIQTIAERNSDGPLSVLKRCFVNKTRIKVWIRNAVGVRGTCVGFVIAYDKHMNLVLLDVEETFKRLKSKVTREVESVTRQVPQLFIKGDCVILISPVE